MLSTIETINKTINTFISQFGEYSCRMGSDFCVYLNENVIEWTLIYVEKGGEAFYNNFIKRFPLAQKLNLFTLSLLHELGHLETEDEIIEDKKEFDTNISDEEYFNLYNEVIATDWAGEWIETHLQEAENLNKKLETIIFNFYKEYLTD